MFLLSILWEILVSECRRFVISDLSLDQANIMEYCYNPMESKDQKNSYLVYGKWNNLVSHDDIVYFLGGIEDEVNPHSWLERLNGDINLIANKNQDFDGIKFQSFIQIKKGDHKFLLTNDLDVVPDNWGSWIIHGSKAVEGDSYFINSDKKMIDVSIKKIDYKPINISYLSNLLDQIDKKKVRNLSNLSEAKQPDY